MSAIERGLYGREARRSEVVSIATDRAGILDAERVAAGKRTGKASSTATGPHATA